MSKYISRTKSKLRFKRIAESEIEQLQGDPMSNKVLAEIIARREALRARQAQRSSEKERMLAAMRNHGGSATVASQPKLDEFEKEYEAFIAEQKKLKAEREAKEAAEKETKIPVITFIEKDPVDEVKDDVVSEETTTSENSEEVQVVETKPKKKSKKKKVVEATETVE